MTDQPTTLPCSSARFQQWPHAPHAWEPQPGTPPVHCPGHEGPARPPLEELDAAPESARWCCDGNAEDCPLCTDPNPDYPWICPGHPDTAENRQRVQAAAEPELTVDEARDLVSDFSADLYWAQDRLAFVGECCDIADREQRAITTADVREWLKGARCGRQLAADAAAATEATGPERCCVCGGAQVAYRNFRDLPFCRPCADCPCGQNPCVRTGVGDPEVSEAAEVQRLRRAIRHIMTGNRAAVDKLTDAHQATIGELRRAEARVRDLEATIERVRALLRQQWAAEGPPPGVSRWWDERLAELDEALESPASGAPVRHVHVTITNPDAYTANRAALSLVDWVRAEFGDSLTLHVTTDAREWGHAEPAATEEQ